MVRLTRIDAIDALRFLCILSVMIFHYTVRFVPPVHDTDVPLHGVQFPAWLGLGKFAVHIFFMISGFVIAQTLTTSSGVVNFFWRRFSRLYPAFFVCATITFVVAHALGNQFRPISFEQYIGNVALLNLAFLNVNWVDGAYWSLGVEVWFYVIIGALWAIFGKWFWLAFAVFVCGALAFESHLADWSALPHLPLFLFGIALWLWHSEARRANALVMMLLSVALFCRLNWAIGGPAITFIAVGAVAITVSVLCAPNISFGLVAELGRCSYATYLIHQIVGVMVMRRLVEVFSLPWAPKIALTIVLLYALGIIVTYLVERPCERWLRALGSHRKRYVFAARSEDLSVRPLRRSRLSPNGTR